MGDKGEGGVKNLKKEAQSHILNIGQKFTYHLQLRVISPPKYFQYSHFLAKVVPW